jgi:hypothetical protein
MYCMEMYVYLTLEVTYVASIKYTVSRVSTLASFARSSVYTAQHSLVDAGMGEFKLLSGPPSDVGLTSLRHTPTHTRKSPTCFARTP